VQGRETIVVRATDAGGLFVDTPIRIDVNNYQNAPPEIEDFQSQWVGGGTRYYWGRITDPDDNLSDVLIYIYGDFFETTVVSDDEGNFAFAVILEEDAWGWEYALACDPQGAWSSVDNPPADPVEPT
jgi:hypothetical protein